MDAEELCATEYARAHPVDAARRLETMKIEESAAFLETLPTSTTRDILTRMQVRTAARCVEELPRPKAVTILRELQRDRASRILRLLTPERAEALLADLPSAQRERIDRVLRYPPHTVGAVMDPIVLTVADDLTVGEARKQLRGVAREHDQYVFVLNRDHQLVGMIELATVFVEDKSQPVRSAMRGVPASVSPFTDLSSLTDHPAWQEVDALAVTGRERQLLGAVRHRLLRQTVTRHGDVRLDELGATVTRIGEIYWTTLGALVITLSFMVAPKAGGTQTRGVAHD